MTAIEFDMSGFKPFFERISKAGNGDLKNELSVWLEALGIELLRIIEDEIIHRDIVDTRLLLQSFTKGNKNNIWEVSDGDLTLEIGTHVDYASYVNNGHWTNPSGVESRFVPGEWNGNKFQYIPDAKTGMILKQKWVEGKHYWDNAMHIFEKIFPNITETNLQQWINKYFEL